MAKRKKRQLPKQPKRKKVRFTSRFYTIMATFFIMLLATVYFWHVSSSRMPNLHGWESNTVLEFAEEHNIEVEFEFNYSNDVAPALVIGQSVTPGTAISEVQNLIVEVSLGIEVR